MPVIFRFDLVTNIRHLGFELLFYRNGNTNYTPLAFNLPWGAGWSLCILQATRFFVRSLGAKKQMRSTPGPLQQMNCFHAVHFELTKYTRRGPDTKGSLSTANKHDSMMPSNSTSRFGNSIAVCNVKRGDEGQNRWNNAILVQVTWLPMDLQRWQSQLFPSCKATVRNRHEVTSYVRDCPLTRLPSSWIANCISVGRIFRHQEYLIWAGATKAINTLIRKKSPFEWITASLSFKRWHLKSQ